MLLIISVIQVSLVGSLLCGEIGFKKDIHSLELMSIVPLKQKAPQTMMEPSPLCSVENRFRVVAVTFKLSSFILISYLQYNLLHQQQLLTA